MGSFVVKSGAVALALLQCIAARDVYTLQKDYSGPNFFDDWDFFSGTDPTSGFVSYQTRDQARTKGLISYDGTAARMSVDSTSNLDANNGPGRASVRIESKAQYTRGLFIGDFGHMPASVCGTWPAFWTYGGSVANGEIDINENINERTVSLQTLHAPNCQVMGNLGVTRQTDRQDSYNCDDQATNSNVGVAQSQYQGCSGTNTDPASYGTTFNQAGGGVYAMEWTESVISIWNFRAGAVPANINNGQPDPSTWGLPAFTTSGGACDVGNIFRNHKIIIDTTFCGNFAGLDFFWKQTSCYNSNPTAYPRCQDYVASNPSAFSQAYWDINNIRVYSLAPEPTTTSSSTTSSSSSTSSTTTTTTSNTSSTTTTSGSSSNTVSTSSSTNQTTTSSSTTAAGGNPATLSTSSFTTMTTGSLNTGNQTTGSFTTPSSSVSAPASVATCADGSAPAGSAYRGDGGQVFGICVGTTYAVISNLKRAVAPLAISSTDPNTQNQLCASYCSQNAGCVGGTITVAPGGSAICTLRSSVANPIADPNSRTLILISGVSGGGNSNGSGSTPTSAVTSTGGSGSGATGANGSAIPTTGPVITSGSGSGAGGSSGNASGTSIVSTVFSTIISTITSCATSITNCPAIVTTTVVPLYTTIVPATVSTVYSLTTYTITSCAATITNCPASLGQVVTSTVFVSMTVCPITATGSVVPVVPQASVVPSGSVTLTGVPQNSAVGVPVSVPAISVPASNAPNTVVPSVQQPGTSIPPGSAPLNPVVPGSSIPVSNAVPAATVPVGYSSQASGARNTTVPYATINAAPATGVSGSVFALLACTVFGIICLL